MPLCKQATQMSSKFQSTRDPEIQGKC